MSDVNILTCLRAVHDLRDGGKPPQTAEEIAAYLHSAPGVVLPLLVELKARRILHDHMRGGRREWGRWGK